MKTTTQTILCTGVFDLLHEEHIAFLKAAKALGGTLVVALERDERVRQIKGEGRPLQNEQERLAEIRSLGIADQVLLLPSAFTTTKDHFNFLQKIKPAILAVSSHTPHLAIKRKLMKQIGGKVVVVRKQNPAISTTKIAKKAGRNNK